MEKRQKKIEFNRKGKCEEGITLLVLVITIIVLLILAGISISMLTGQKRYSPTGWKSKRTNRNRK